MRDGREYLTFPVVPLRELVYEYPEHGTSEYLPADALQETVDAWNGTPIVPRHPTNRRQSAVDPDVYMESVIGELHDVELIENGTAIAGTAYVDVEKAQAAGELASDVVDRLLEGETLAVSAGYGVLEERRENGLHDGESYDLVQGPPVPDHVAVFPNDEFRARCTPADGCRANATDSRLNALLERVRTLATDADAADADADADADAAETIAPGPVGDYYVAEDDESETETETDSDPEDSTMQQQSDSDDDTTATEMDRLLSNDDVLDELAARVAEHLESESESDDTRTNATATAGDDCQCQRTTNAVDVASYPAAGRSGYEERKRREELGIDLLEDAAGQRQNAGCGCGCGGDGETRANYAGRPGRKDRTPDEPETTVDDYPAGGRSGYEQRKRENSDAEDGDADGHGHALDPTDVSSVTSTEQSKFRRQLRETLEADQ